jgi:aspartate dehydrogenase
MNVKRVSVIGAGRIGGPVLDYLKVDKDWHLGAVLVRDGSHGREPWMMSDADRFFATDADLIVEVAGSDALRMHGSRALSMADVWTISGAALADDTVFQRLAAAGSTHGHRLRLLSGSVGGLDGVSTIATVPGARLHVTASRPGLTHAAGTVYSGSARDAARHFPDETNIAVAAALAGPGLEATKVTLINPGARGDHVLSLSAQSRVGSFTASLTVEPNLAKGMHPVAASIIAALRREAKTIWVG